MPSALEQRYSPQAGRSVKLVKLADRLLPGESMQRGKRLSSRNGAYFLAFQQDGNLVLYNQRGQAYWSPNLVGQGATNAVMQKDGNFVIYAGTRPLFSTGTQRFANSYLVMQEDGNLVIYQGTLARWSTETMGGHLHKKDGGFLGLHVSIAGPIEWLGHAASSAGRSLAHGVAEGIKSAADLVGKIPLVGAPLHAVLGIAAGPFNLLSAIVSGERIDRALLASVKDEFSAIREVAPYAKMLLTAMPGLGTGIGVGLAMAEAAVGGRPIDQILLAGVAGVVPGGVVGKAVFQFTQRAMAGDNLIRTAGNVGLAQLPPEARGALDTVAAAAKGENIPKAALENARKALPQEAQVALNAGIALGQGQKLQNTIIQGIQGMGQAQLDALAAKGNETVGKSDLFRNGIALVKNTQQSDGYKIGVAIMGCAGVNETSIYQFRQKLQVEARVGFDLAISTQIGKVRSRLAPASLPPVAKAAFYTTKGMAGGAKQQKATMMKVVVANPAGREGATVAVKEMPHTWWQKVIAFIFE